MKALKKTIINISKWLRKRKTVKIALGVLTGFGFFIGFFLGKQAIENQQKAEEIKKQVKKNSTTINKINNEQKSREKKRGKIIEESNNIANRANKRRKWLLSGGKEDYPD